MSMEPFMMKSVQLLVILILIKLCSSEIGPKVSTKLGTIEGSYAVSYKGNIYHAFEGIPYALPPLGDRRFEIPEPILPWSTELKAHKSIRCVGNMNGAIVGDEDCLYLNIYSPPKGNSSLPVVVYIHPGAFQFGYYKGKEPYYLIDHGIIFVAINYRLGILGFLSTEDEIVPGNMGLKDQALALKWIKENIESFGGDPDRVTLTGLSAGGASVHYHYMSPMSSGLFHAGISFSGTAFDCWAQTENSREKAIKLGSMMDCPTNDTMLMVQCLKKIPARVLTESLTRFMPWHSNPFTPFGPVVEKPNPNAFIDRSPAEIIHEGAYSKVPWITGIVKDEGLIPAAGFAEDETALQDLNENWESIAPNLLDFCHTVPERDHSHIAKRIREFYFGDTRINKENFNILARLVGDRLFKFDAVKAAIAQAKSTQAPVWFFHYSYRAATSWSQYITNSTKDYGVCHSDDAYMVVGNDIIEPSSREEDFKMHEILLKLWISVARTRTPRIGFEWAKVDSKGTDLTYKTFNFLNISSPLNIREQMNIESIQSPFWDSLDFDENRIDEN